MSDEEELHDEVEALNSIYGPDTLVPSDEDPAVYILSLPHEASSLRLHFPPTYPSAPPAVLGTHSSGTHAKRGSAARDLTLFRDAVAAVYQPGQVCLYDAVEQFTEQLGSTTATDADADADAATATAAAGGAPAAPPSPPASPQLPDPGWVLSEPVTELKSTFVGRCARARGAEEAAGFVRQLLATDRRARAATHNITAWRVRGAGGTAFQDCDDDGETAAGGRLLHLLQLMDVWDAVVVVTRWYGGHKLGPRRFALINSVARDALVRAGFVAEGGAARKKGAGKT